MRQRVANRKESLLGFLNRFGVVEAKDRDAWSEVLSDPLITSKAVFWYPASGLHLDPLLHRGMPNIWHDEIGLYIYTDYGVREDRFRILHEQMGKVRIKVDSRFHHIPTPLDQGLESIEITQMIPLKPTDAGLRAILQRYGREGLSSRPLVNHVPYVDAAGCPHDDSFWFIAMQGWGSKYRMLFGPVDHMWLLNGALIPAGVQIDYLCAHKDGCAKGGAWVCCNNIADIFFRTVMSSPCRPKYWITDHWSSGVPPGFRALGAGNWGGYEGLTKVYQIQSA